MASYSNISQNLLEAAERASMEGVKVNDKIIGDMTIKLLSYDPLVSDKGSKVDQLLNVLIEAEANRVILEQEESGVMNRIYDEALLRVNSWGGVTGFLSPEGGRKKG
jgi:hypothetical protein